uniref:leucine-rich repeat-containing protein 40 n=1 Tax=Myxine glutinosa TaxID=7769 RepID=UPI00358E5918
MSGIVGKSQTQRDQHVLSGLLKRARKSGYLDLNNHDFTEVPSAVWRINVDAPEEAQKDVCFAVTEQWWEQTDLVKLLLPFNCLSKLHEDIRLLPALTILDVHENQLVELPSALWELENLQRLNLSHNKLSSLPEQICGLYNLRSFQLQFNNLRQLPDGIGMLAQLEELDLSHNQLTLLPPTLGNLKNLVRLSIASNSLKSLPPEISGMKALQELNVTQNCLDFVPEELGTLPNLQMLFLQQNQLSSVPRLGCTKLKELHVGNNRICTLHKEQLETLTSLNVLDLRDNQLEALPSEIDLLHSLQRLDLSNNSLSSLPSSLGTLNKLHSLTLQGNPLRSVRRDIISRGTQGILKYLRSRIEEPKDASGIGEGAGLALLSEPHLDRHFITTLKTLMFSNKQAAEVSDEVFDAAAKATITTANFSRNMLTEIPSRIAELKDSVIDVNFGFNKIDNLSPAFTSLVLLTHVDLRNNRLSSLPSEMEALVCLQCITISFNRFTVWPPVLYRLFALETVLANDNHISEIDAVALQRLPNLATLDLRNNDIQHVPPALAHCPVLRALLIGGNPFRTPRPAIIAKGTAAVLDYLRSRIGD